MGQAVPVHAMPVLARPVGDGGFLHLREHTEHFHRLCVVVPFAVERAP